MLLLASSSVGHAAKFRIKINWNSGTRSGKFQINDRDVGVLAYKKWFNWVGQHAQYHRLPKDIRRQFQRYYNVPLSRIRVAHSNRLAGNAAMTDCYTIYLADARTAQALRKKQLTEKQTRLMLHELAHAEQCKQAGGRDAYARRWWRELGQTASGSASINRRSLHKKMPMEKQARHKVAQILQHTRQNRD